MATALGPEGPQDNTIPGISNFVFKRKAWKPVTNILVQSCNRCGRKIYPVEKVDVGSLYHKGCFKCVTCGRQLTFQTVQVGPSDATEDGKDVYCPAHVPKHSQTRFGKDAVGIKSAIDAQRITSAKNRMQDVVKGWQYNPIGPMTDRSQYQDSGPSDLPPENQPNYEADAQKENSASVEERRQNYTEDVQQQTRTPMGPKSDIRLPDFSMQSVDAFIASASPNYSLRRRSTLRSFKDFEKHGIFDAQDKLERLHKQEEDQLYKQIFSERKQQISHLEELLRMEKERTVNELIEWFEHHGFSPEEKQSMIDKVEAYYQQQRQERMMELLQHLAGEEQAAVARLIERHSREMLMLIAHKERMADSAGAASAEAEPHLHPVEMAEDTEVLPPDNRKSQLYTDPEVFNEQDQQAIQEAQREHDTFTELVRQLSRKCQNELQKVRAIFRWITVKDLNKLEFDPDLDPDSPLGLLRGIKYGTESYHDLFRRLCSYAGIYVEIVEGYSKGAGYRPGTKIQGNKFRNQWTVACVDGCWRFINCNWGARRVTRAGAKTLHYKCDEFYFLTDPEEHIYQHFPKDPKWQLLHEPFDFEDFQRLPLVKSPFFNNDLNFSDNYGAVLIAKNGLAEVQIQCLKMPVLVMAKLTPRLKDGAAKAVPDSTLVRYVETDVVVSAALPYTGKYYLDIFVGDDWYAESMDLACSFLLICQKQISYDRTFPPVGYLGRTPVARKLHIILDNIQDPHVVAQGDLNLTFSYPEDLRMRHTLIYWDARERRLKAYDNYALLRQKTNTLAVYYFRFPKKGLYAFSLFAAKPHDKRDMQCAWKVLIDCQQASDRACALPTTTVRWSDCKLMEPMDGILPVSSRVRFKIHSIRHVEMTVFVDGNWFSLEIKDGIWVGSLPTCAKPGKVIVYGRTDANSSKLVPMLEYKVL